MEKPKYVYITYIKTTPEKLWAALTKPEFTRQYWFDSGIESDWKVGSPVRFHREGQTSSDQPVLKFEPPRLLSYAWPVFQEELRHEHPSRVTFEIEALPDSPVHAVKLTVTHDDFPANSKSYPLIQNGWPAVLSSLKSLLESGTALSMGIPGCQAAHASK